MKAEGTSETSANFYHTTWRNIPEDGHLHTRRSENLKSHHNHARMRLAGKIRFQRRNGNTSDRENQLT
jgi:hypothetical protein